MSSRACLAATIGFAIAPSAPDTCPSTITFADFSKAIIAVKDMSNQQNFFDQTSETASPDDVTESFLQSIAEMVI
jgi:hypothetical protein